MKHLIKAVIVFFIIFNSCTQARETIKPPANFPIQIKHTDVLCQGKTNTCWAFSTLSFLESEIIRETGKSYHFSPMWLAYHAYLEKTSNFLQKNGKARFHGGGLAHDVISVIKKYGIVRLRDYSGLLPTAAIHNHKKLDQEIKLLVTKLAAIDTLSVNEKLNRVKSVLNRYLGTPPDKIEINGNQLTPLQFANEFLAIPFDDYFQITSFSSYPFYDFTELQIPDNWQHHRMYFNVPLDVFVDLLQFSQLNGYSVVIDMDISEQGYHRTESYAVLTDPPDSINQNIREKLFQNKKTTDDHLQHLVGFNPAADSSQQTWYLIKDSLPWSFKSPSNGYVYMREDYLKLKVLSFMVHKNAVSERLFTKYHQPVCITDKN